jgi:hypothetical protein
MTIFHAIKSANKMGSGKNEEKYMGRLMDIFRTEEGKPFCFPKCIEHLVQLPKWSDEPEPSELPEELEDEDEKQQGKSGFNSKRISLARPIGTKTAIKKAKIEKAVTKANEKTSNAVCEVANGVRGLNSVIEFKAKLDQQFRLLEFYEQKGDEEKVAQTLKNMEEVEEQYNTAKTELQNSCKKDGNKDRDEKMDEEEKNENLEGNCEKDRDETDSESDTSK